MKLPAYPKYKPSGVEWLGEVPEHWTIKRLSRLAACLDGRRIPLNREERSERQGPYPYWGANGVVDHIDEWLFDDQLVLLGEDGAPFFAPNKEVAFFVTGRIWVNNHAHVLRPVSGTSGKFLAHALNQTEYGAFIDGSTRDKLTQDAMNAITIVMPPESAEQCAIVDFLDRETAKIDTLVAKKRTLVERLKEKRTALISRTVTRGLPPDAARAAGLDPHPKLKPSGIDWLGDVPAHWAVVQLKWAVMFQRGHDLPADQREEGDVPLVSSSGVSATHSRSAARGPGIVTGRYGTIGEFYLVAEDYWPLNTTLYSVDLRGNEPRFLQRMLTHLSPLFLLNAVKSAVPGVDRNDIHPISAALPPVPEQRAIADFLDRETIAIDRMISKIDSVIERLQEYRTALITAAVTGKIDVRQLAAKGAQA